MVVFNKLIKIQIKQYNKKYYNRYIKKNHINFLYILKIIKKTYRTNILKIIL